MQRVRLAVGFLLLVHSAFGATSYWRNTSAGLFSTSANWVGGVPGSADTAVFTNATSLSVQWNSAATTANASFRGTGTVTQDIQAASWTVRTNYSVGNAPNADAAVILSSGTLNVTNQAHTARMVIGETGKGSFTLQGGTLNVDSLLSTNGTNSVFRFDYGTFASRGMDLTSPEGLWAVGTTSNQVTKWLIEGTNALKTTETYGYWLNVGLGVAPGAQVAAVVRGTNSSLQVNGNLYLGFQSDAPSELVITNGASADISVLSWGGSGFATNSSGHRVVVTGPSSHLNARLDFSADDSSLLVSNGAAVYAADSYMLRDGDRILVTGTNSLLTLNSLVLDGSSNEVTVTNGATIEGDRLIMSGQDAALRVIGGNVTLGSLQIAGTGSCLLDQAFVTVIMDCYVWNPAGFDFRSGVLRMLSYAVAELHPLYIGGYPNRATLELSALDATGSIFQFYSPVILRTNASLLIFGGDLLTSLLSATNGTSNQVQFNRGTWTTEGTQIQMGRVLEVGDGTNAALFRFSGGTHTFADGLRVRTGSSVTGAGSIIGTVTFDAQSTWLCDLTDRPAQQNQPFIEVSGNLSIHGVLVLTNLSPFVPARYVLATYSGTLDTTGMTMTTGLPDSFSTILDTSVPGELAVRVKFIGPLPSNTIGNVVAISHATSLSFETVNSATYRVEYSDSLSPATWLPLVELPGTSSMVSVVDTNAVTNQRFYRLKTTY